MNETNHSIGVFIYLHNFSNYFSIPILDCSTSTAQLDNNMNNYNSDQNHGTAKERCSLTEAEYQPVRTTPELIVSSSPKSEEDEDKQGKTQKESIFLYLCVISAAIVAFSSGIGLSWTSPVLPKLDTDENPFPHQVTITQKAWIAAIAPLGSAAGPLCAGYCADRLGRKKALFAIAVPMFVGYLILAAASQVELYYFARFIIGLGVGSSFAIVPMYVGEISQSFSRGKFGCFISLSMVMGFFLPFSIGPHLSIRLYALLCAAPLATFLIVSAIFMPESPYFLVQTGNYYLANSILRKLRPREHNVQKELSQIDVTVKKSLERKARFIELFISKVSRRTLVISLGIVLLQQLAGIHPLLSYLKSIFQASGSSIHPNLCTLIIGTVEVTFNFLCCAIVERLGRKPLLIFSAVGSALSIFSLGVFFYLKSNGFNVDSILWLPVTCLIGYYIFFSLGLGPLPWVIVGELFPMNIKGLSIAFCATLNFLISAFITFLFPIVSQYIGMYGVFWIFSINCILGAFFIYFIVPETKGKSLGQVQDILLKLVD